MPSIYQANSGAPPRADDDDENGVDPLDFWMDANNIRPSKTSKQEHEPAELAAKTLPAPREGHAPLHHEGGGYNPSVRPTRPPGVRPAPAPGRGGRPARGRGGRPGARAAPGRGARPARGAPTPGRGRLAPGRGRLAPGQGRSTPGRPTPGRLAPGRLAPGRLAPNAEARPATAGVRPAPGRPAPGRAAPGRAARGRGTAGLRQAPTKAIPAPALNAIPAVRPPPRPVPGNSGTVVPGGVQVQPPSSPGNIPPQAQGAPAHLDLDAGPGMSEAAYNAGEQITTHTHTRARSNSTVDATPNHNRLSPNHLVDHQAAERRAQDNLGLNLFEDAMCDWSMKRRVEGQSITLGTNRGDYTGEVNSAGYPHGEGRMVFETKQGTLGPNGININDTVTEGIEGETYHGGWRDGFKQGQGTLKLNSDEWEGTWHMNQLLEATHRFANGDVEVGRFESYSYHIAKYGALWTDSDKKTWLVRDGRVDKQFPMADAVKVAKEIGVAPPVKFVGARLGAKRKY